MKIFINDIPVYIFSLKKINPSEVYNVSIEKDEKIRPEKFIGNVLIKNSYFGQINDLLKLLTKTKFENVSSISIATDKKKWVIRHLKEKFTVIKAAGGIVRKKNKYLLIYRKQKWDFPKGKLEKKEKIKECAKREVEEETGVKVALLYKIDAVWHTYLINKKYVMKKTYWYAMKCTDDSKMKPQLEEGIKKVEWGSLQKTQSVLKESYQSLKFVFQKYIEKEEPDIFLH